MTIYEIKRQVTNAPHFFTRNSMKFFNQTLKDFSVYKMDTEGDALYRIAAPMTNNQGRNVGQTIRIFNSVTNKFQ